ncbi:uncharacterized protein LOC112344800 isoform X1 [Selaginella moellendorffii]|uniref:uncharacterized protein LOC112344800 isoform X1 n=1 Tax=Selaginella moellendorffii TaxID=88036 RepID=UPI000D1C8BE0|nr:uncharacterized protein LOC112344800 isoform X1 [Selaginella moellendorffii]|eukprot:XP_024525920.1 uncharacterized protein LOC112344800 isoform X1 [Selaginella moellendorffii]
MTRTQDTCLYLILASEGSRGPGQVFFFLFLTRNNMEKLQNRSDLEVSVCYHDLFMLTHASKHWQEIGEIFFFYRPKIDVEHPHSAGEVQRLYMVLRPVAADNSLEVKQDPHSENVKETLEESKDAVEGKKEADDIQRTVNVKGTPKEGDRDGNGDEKSAGELREEIKDDKPGEQGMQEVDLTTRLLMRLIIVGRKVLPDPAAKGRPAWSYVDLVTTSIQAMKDSLSAHEYDTKTRGHRVQPGARPAGEGVYCILKHKNHTHLIYKLDKPKEEHTALQEELNLEKEASFIISAKNPSAGAPPNAGLGNKRKAMYPAKLQALMGSYRFVPVHPPDLLNYEGCEFILVPASDDIDKELGVELQPEDYDTKLCADIAKMVDIESDVIRKPLFHGEWA